MSAIYFVIVNSFDLHMFVLFVYPLNLGNYTWILFNHCRNEFAFNITVPWT